MNLDKAYKKTSIELVFQKYNSKNIIEILSDTIIKNIVSTYTSKPKLIFVSNKVEKEINSKDLYNIITDMYRSQIDIRLYPDNIHVDGLYSYYKKIIIEAETDTQKDRFDFEIDFKPGINKFKKLYNTIVKIPLLKTFKIKQLYYKIVLNERVYHVI